MSAFTFNESNEAHFAALLTRYPKKDSLMLPSLWMAQYQEGWVSPPAMEYIAQKLECSPMDVYAVASFYTMFNLKPVGTYHIQLCKTLSCMLRGSQKMQAHIETKLGIKPGQTTKDGKFTFTLVECLGSCGSAPCMSFNEDYKENLTLETLDTLIEEAK